MQYTLCRHARKLMHLGGRSEFHCSPLARHGALVKRSVHEMATFKSHKMHISEQYLRPRGQTHIQLHVPFKASAGYVAPVLSMPNLHRF